MNNELDIELPDNFSEYSKEKQKSIIEYLSQLNDIQKQAYSIAKKHLGSSFHILKSNAYIEWLKQKTSG
jgi:hypothetical protein